MGIFNFAAAFAHSIIAVICGTPTPATIRVVQIEPGPIPTFTALTPALMRSFVPSAVPTLPAINSISNFARTRFTISMTPWECPCAVSMTTTSTPAATSALTRSSVSAVMPAAAPTRNRPCLSLQAFGWRFFF